jgi:hypothetical protein
MNKPILCCLKIKPATLLVGLVDLTLHMSLLATLFASYTRPDIFDHYYANSLSLVSSSSSSCLSAGSVSHFKTSVDLVIPQSEQSNSQVAAASSDNDEKNLQADSSFNTNFFNSMSISDQISGNTSQQIMISSKILFQSN